MRRIGLGFLSVIFLAMGIAVHGPPAQAQVVTEDWPQQANSALQQGNCDLALELIHGARRTHDSLGDSVLAGLYRRGECVDRNLPQALALYRASDAQGNELAAPFIGYLYLKGLGTRANREAARHWFRKSALAVIAVPPELRLSFMRALLGDLEVPPEFEEELDWLFEIEQGDAEAQYELALKVRDGNGLPQVIEAAKKWLRQAGDKGFPKAHHELGLMLLNDIYGPRNPGSGFFNLGLAAEAGYGPSQKVIALHYAAGRYLRQADLNAYIWLLIAEESGEDVAKELAEVAARLSDVEREVAMQHAAEGPAGGPFPAATSRD